MANQPVEAKDFVEKCKPKLADIIAFDRTVYRHYGMYDGSGYVINVPAEDKNTKEVKILREKLVDVANKVPGKTKVFIHNQEEAARKLKSLINYKKIDLNRKVEDQIKDARSFINVVVPYDFVSLNCEYYVNMWKYGQGFTTQLADDPKRCEIEDAISAEKLGLKKSDFLNTKLDDVFKL